LKKIFIQSDGKPVGPSSVEEVRSLISAGWLAMSNPAQYEGDEKWQPLSSMPEFSDSAPASPERLSPPPAVPEPVPAPRKPLELARYLRGAFRVLLLLALLGLVALGGIYVARYGGDILKRAGSIRTSNLSVGTNNANTEPATNAATSAPAANADPVPAQGARVVQLTAAPTNTTPAPWERASQASNAATTAVLTRPTTNPSPPVVEHRSVVSNIDPKSTPFGAYDVQVIQAVQKRWFALVDRNPVLRLRTGRVVVSFQLFRDGSVANVKVIESSGDGVEEYLCQQAVNDSKPFPNWPASTAVNNDSRELRFTFQY